MVVMLQDVIPDAPAGPPPPTAVAVDAEWRGGGGEVEGTPLLPHPITIANIKLCTIPIRLLFWLIHKNRKTIRQTIYT